LSPPDAHDWNTAVGRGTVIDVPVSGSRAVLVHAAPGAGVYVVGAPYAGPGYAVTPDGVHTCVTGCTSNAFAVHDPANTSNSVNDTAEIVPPPYVEAKFPNCRKLFAFSLPSNVPTFNSDDPALFPGNAESANVDDDEASSDGSTTTGNTRAGSDNHPESTTSFNAGAPSTVTN
jgi:hypothetical protein